MVLITSFFISCPYGWFSQIRSHRDYVTGRGGRQGSREPKTAQCGAVLLNANVWDLRLFSVRFFAAGPKVDPRVKCIMS